MPKINSILTNSLLMFFTMVEEDFQFKRSQMHQNERFLVKFHSVFHHGWRIFWIFTLLNAIDQIRFDRFWFKKIFNLRDLKCTRIQDFLVKSHSVFYHGWRNLSIEEHWNAPKWRIFLVKSTLYHGWKIFRELVFLQQNNNNFIPQCSFIFVKFSISRTSLYPSSCRTDTCLQHIFKNSSLIPVLLRFLRFFLLSIP